MGAEPVLFGVMSWEDTASQRYSSIYHAETDVMALYVNHQRYTPPMVDNAWCWGGRVRWPVYIRTALEYRWVMHSKARYFHSPNTGTGRLYPRTTCILILVGDVYSYTCTAAERRCESGTGIKRTKVVDFKNTAVGVESCHKNYHTKLKQQITPPDVET